MYPSRRFDVLGLVQRRRRGGPGAQRDSGAPGLGVYSAWLGGLPGFLSGVRPPAGSRIKGGNRENGVLTGLLARPRRVLCMAGRAAGLPEPFR